MGFRRNFYFKFKRIILEHKNEFSFMTWVVKLYLHELIRLHVKPDFLGNVNRNVLLFTFVF